MFLPLCVCMSDFVHRITQKLWANFDEIFERGGNDKHQPIRF